MSPLDTGKPYQRNGERQAATVIDCGTLLSACPLHLKLDLISVIIEIVVARLERNSYVDLEECLPDWIRFFNETQIHCRESAFGLRERWAEQGVLNKVSS